ncbi:DNA topoisomerase 2 [Sorghum bicolor]|uniref:DNA topoisomerase 2 n=1 Tax=Sorghum bicolor TaxID=4558 RepID=UPI000B424536|nr:DNA topoisomerase 2 [Sorghum bicolor]|eukprot:XP_021306038.1 DNA topoisomerase 2 [Sorghum bicolor]
MVFANLPMILVNGAEGIGTGWSTKIPCYNPKDIVHNLKLKIQGSETLEEMKPWFRHFHGEVSVKNKTTKTKKSGVTYTASGIIKVVDKTTLKISELPVKISMENYERKLKTFMDGEDKFIKSYEKKRGGNDVEIMIHLHENSENLVQANEVDLQRKFELRTSMGTSNMHLLDSNGIIKKNDSPEQSMYYLFATRPPFFISFVVL